MNTVSGWTRNGGKSPHLVNKAVVYKNFHELIGAINISIRTLRVSVIKAFMLLKRARRRSMLWKLVLSFQVVTRAIASQIDAPEKDKFIKIAYNEVDADVDHWGRTEPSIFHSAID